jgi:hypothetical protein
MLALKLRRQEQEHSKRALVAAAVTQEPTPPAPAVPSSYRASFSHGSRGGPTTPTVTTASRSSMCRGNATANNAEDALLYQHDPQQPMASCSSSTSNIVVGSVVRSSIGRTNRSAAGGDAAGRHRRTRRRRVKKNEGESLREERGRASMASKRRTASSSSSCGSVGATSVTFTTASTTKPASSFSSPGASSSSSPCSSPLSSPCSKKRHHDAPMTKRDLYFSLRCCGMVVGNEQQHSLAAVGRVTVVNWDNQVLLDTLVRPASDCRTTQPHDSSMRDSKATPTALSLEVVRAQVAALLKGKILIGHGLDVDLAALGLSHPGCDMRDTATYPPYMKKQSVTTTDSHPIRMTSCMILLPHDLDDLLSHFLGRQSSWSCTNQQPQQQQRPSSKLVMEAIACLDLYKMKRHEWEAELMLLSRQKQRQRQVMLDMRNNSAQLTCMTDDSNTLGAELSSSVYGTAVTSASGRRGGRFMTQYDRHYKNGVNDGQHGSPPPLPPPPHFSSVETPAGSSEDDGSTDATCASSSYNGFRHQDHGNKSCGSVSSHPPPGFVYEQQPTATSKTNTWRTGGVTAVDYDNNLDYSWLLGSEHGSGTGTIGGSDSVHSIWSPLVPTPTATSSSPVSPCNMTSVTSPKGSVPLDWSIGTSPHSNLAGAAPPSFGPWQEQHQHQRQPLAVNNTPTTSFTAEEQVMEHLVASLLNLSCDPDDDDSTPPRSAMTSLDSSLSLPESPTTMMMQPEEEDLSPSYSSQQQKIHFLKSTIGDDSWLDI